MVTHTGLPAELGNKSILLWVIKGKGFIYIISCKILLFQVSHSIFIHAALLEEIINVSY